MNTPIYLDIEESASRLNNITFVDKKFLSTIVLTKIASINFFSIAPTLRWPDRYVDVTLNVFEMSDSFARTLSVLSRARRLCGV